MRLSLAALLLLSTATIAHADTFQTFTLSGTMTSGSFQGTVTLDQTTGMFTSESSLFMTSDSGDVMFDEALTSTGHQNGFSFAQFQNGSFSAYVEINLPSLVNYQGGQLCTTTALCPGGHVSLLLANNGNFTSGSLTPVAAVGPSAGSAATPEPSSLLLLGTGLLGFAGAARRKFLKA